MLIIANGCSASHLKLNQVTLPSDVYTICLTFTHERISSPPSCHKHHPQHPQEGSFCSLEHHSSALLLTLHRCTHPTRRQNGSPGPVACC
jgi:hypothetical protein